MDKSTALPVMELELNKTQLSHLRMLVDDPLSRRLPSYAKALDEGIATLKKQSHDANL